MSGFQTVTDRVGGVGGTMWTAAKVTDIYDSLDQRAFNVKDPVFGAVGNGVANDLAAFTAAITAAAASGGRVFVPPGTYAGLASLSPPSNAVIEGAGEGATILRSPASPTSPVFDLSGVNNVTLRGFSLAIPSGTASSNGHGVRVKGGCSDILIEDVKADGFVSAVYLDGSAAGSAANAVFDLWVDSRATTGTFKIGFQRPDVLGEVQWTGSIARNASAGTVQTALEALAGIGAGQVTVTGGALPSAKVTITFGGTIAGLWIPPLLVVDSLGTGEQVMVTEVTRGGGPWITNATLRRVTALNSPTAWGIHADYVNGLILDGCRSRGHYADGVKLRKFVNNWQVLGGDFSKNGVSWVSDPANGGGDGLDAYPGGENVRVVGASFNDNFGNGLQLKNDDGATAPNNLSGYASGKFGLNRKLDLIGIAACRNLVGHGVAITENQGSASYAVSFVTVSGGLFEDNAFYGLLLTGRHVAVQGTKARRNRDTGIVVGGDAQHVDIDGAISVANGSGAGTGYGLRILGKHVRVRGGFYVGTDTDALAMNTDISALTKYHAQNILVESTAQDVVIDGVVEEHNSSGRGIQVQAGTDESIVVNQTIDTTLTPGSSLLYGSVGSIVQRPKSSSGADAAWVKVAGAVNATGVWKRLGGMGVAAVSASSTATGSEDLILVTAGATDKTITLPAAAGVKGVALTVKRVDGAAGNVIVDPNGSETIDGAATKTLGAQNSAITIASNGTNWSTLSQLGTVT